jgi:hypothetical protein
MFTINMKPEDNMLDLLYSTINKIGKEKIQIGVHSDYNESAKFIDLILKSMNNRSTEINDQNLLSVLEAMLHFMLTVCTLPSVRKVEIDNISLDIVIPNLHMLRTSPDKSLVIQFINTPDNIEKLQNLNQIQLIEKNIWIISIEPVPVSYKNYTLRPKNRQPHYNTIAIDISKFLQDVGDNTMRFLH